MALIRIENASVDFMLASRARTSFKDTLRAMAIGGFLRRAHGQLGVSALSNINLEIKDGDRVGILGANGAGKTTLLKLMAGILPPTEGKIRIEGDVSALLSLYLGATAENTGYENIVSRARLMGRTEAEINAHYAEIAEFSELGDFLNLPMKTYSAGMSLRLMFAVATAFEPDILILDEWLSAGDDAFRRKAADRLNSLIERTRIVVFASHSRQMLKQVCNKAIILEHGSAVFAGSIDDALDERAKAAPSQLAQAAG
ncbi:MAG: ABC transporter ATP-binding protein [Parvularculaceae bacterium]|nr:ABC transporter ATP-binding protein [Parvularculaceae bacterium]